MCSVALSDAIATVPPGAWAIGVSGGADSVAMLRLAATRPDLSLVVVHIDHELRGAESDGDAAYVAELCKRLGLPCEIVRRSEIEMRHAIAMPNASARYRAARHAAFGEAIARRGLAGVLLAHHRDDQAETILQRLLRGGPITSLAGMAARSRVSGVAIERPLLGVRRTELRAYLAQVGQPFREDASNASPRQQRNRLRMWLAGRDDVTDALVQLGEACRAWRSWLGEHTPELPREIPTAVLADLPLPIARAAAARWLRSASMPDEGSSVTAADRVLSMARDAAVPGDAVLPGGVRIRRRRGTIMAAQTGNE